MKSINKHAQETLRQFRLTVVFRKNRQCPVYAALFLCSFATGTSSHLYQIDSYVEFIVQVLASINQSNMGDAPANSPTLFRDPGSRAPGRRWACSGLDRLAVRRCSAPTLRRSAGARGGDGGHGMTVLLRFASC